MRFYAFSFFLAFMMAIQLFNQFFSVSIESFLNVFGYSMAESMEALTEIDDTVSMFFYVVFIGPVAEEIMFRGVVLHSLKKYGKIFAVVISSLAFGLMHGNLYQLLFAFGIGLMLAYITLEYSFKWAVVLHILNNLIFGEFILFLTKRFSETVIARFQFFSIQSFYFRPHCSFSEVSRYSSLLSTTSHCKRTICTHFQIDSSTRLFCCQSAFDST